MPSDKTSIDPLAQLDQDLQALEVAAASAPSWDPTSVESMVDWLEREAGLIVRSVPKIDRLVRQVVADLQARRRIRVIVIGPRGGGKTMLAAALQLLSMRFFGASWTSVGGSLEQATRLFEHVRGFVARSGDLQTFIVEALATRIRGKSGATITVHAASEKSIRGQHPRGPSGAGGIVLDEAALIEDRVVDAALPQVASAEPSIVLMLSTLGESMSGRFYELTQQHAERGYSLFEFGVFDVVRRCPYVCESTCPVPAFAKDDHREGPDGQLRSVRKALCAGKAHDPDGWLAIDEVAQQFRDLPRESFEREFLGNTTSRVGSVYRTEDIDAAVIDQDLTFSRVDNVEEHRHRLRALEKAIGLDWGYAGETWAVYLVRLRDEVVAYRFEYWSETRFSEIRRHLVERIYAEQIGVVLPDAASPSDNQELFQMLSDRAERPRRGDERDFECLVEPVAFGSAKSYGIGEVRRRLENRLLRFPRSFGGQPVPNFERAMKLLKAYRYDQNGAPLKKDDHVADALLAGVLCWSPRRVVEPLVLY